MQHILIDKYTFENLIFLSLSNKDAIKRTEARPLFDIVYHEEETLQFKLWTQD